MALTKVAVIIPTLNAAEYLPHQIKALRNQKRHLDEIIVVDSSSEDQTVAIAVELGLKIIRIDKDAFDHGATRNLAAAETEAEIIVYMTQDALPVDSHTVESLVKPLEEDTTVISYARQVAADWASPSEKYLRLSNYPPVSRVKRKKDIPVMGIKTFQNSNVCAAYRSRELKALGSFPEPAVCNEDMTLAARAIFKGYSVAYCAEAMVWHTHSFGICSFFRRYFDIGASLDYEPGIKKLARAEENGLWFFKEQLKYLQKEKQLNTLPRVILETGAKYSGYKCGLLHNYIPAKWKIKFGMNELYWKKVVKKS